MQTTREELDPHVASLKTRVDGLGTDLHRLNNFVTSLSAEMRDGFGKLQSALADKNKAPWGLMISFASLVLLGISTVGWLARQPLVDGVLDTRAQLLRETELRRTDDYRIRDRQDHIQTQLDYTRGQLDMLLGPMKRQ